MADAAVDKKEVVSEEEVVTKKVEKEVEKAEDKAEGENGSGDAASPKENGDDKTSKDEETTENGDSTEVAPAATKRKSVGESGDAPEAEGENGDAANEDGETPEKKAKIEEKAATPTKGAEDTSANGEAEAVA